MTPIKDLLERTAKGLTEETVCEVIDLRAQTHAAAPHAKGPSPAAINAEIEGLLKQLEAAEGCFDPDLITSLRKIFAAAFVRNNTLLTERQKTHARHIAEGNAVDTMADLAGILFALIIKDRRDLAFLGLNRYLKKTDDFSGLRLIYFYGALQALRYALALTQACLVATQEKQKKDFKAQAATAAEFALLFLSQKAGVRVLAIGGLSGAGKTTLGRALSPKILAIHVRSDAVRKHLFGVPVESKAPLEAYNVEHSERTYRGLEQRLDYALDAGFNVIVDGVYANELDRDNLENICHHKGVSFTGIWCSVPADVAQRRIVDRLRDRSADERGYETDLVQHEKQLLLNPGRITWHRLDTLFGVEQLVGRCMSLVDLSS